MIPPWRLTNFNFLLKGVTQKLDKLIFSYTCIWDVNVATLARNELSYTHFTDTIILVNIYKILNCVPW